MAQPRVAIAVTLRAIIAVTLCAALCGERLAAERHRVRIALRLDLVEVEALVLRAMRLCALPRRDPAVGGRAR
jgi:predicted nucleic acid-binding Zn ribbon protein